MDLESQLSSFQSPTDDVPKPTVADFAYRQTVAPGDEALLSAGLVYQAPWQNPADGMAVHARRQVRALAAAGLPVALQSFGPVSGAFTDDEMDADVLCEVGSLRNVSFQETVLAVRQLVIHSARSLEAAVVPGAGRWSGVEVRKQLFAATIVYTSWERSTVEPSIVEILNRCAQVWVPCSQNRDAFVSAGVSPERIRVVPCPYDPATLPAAQIPGPRGKEDVPDGRRFYSIGKWEPRKGHHRLVGAFLRAFGPADRCSLFIKTSGYSRWAGYPGPQESIDHWAADAAVKGRWSPAQLRKLVRIVDAKMSEEDLAQVHRQNNIYVSCSHGEAWELPAFDAVAAGNSLVHVPWGGSADYALLSAVDIPFFMAPVDPGYGWEQDALWAEYDDGSVVEALRRAVPPRRRVHPPDLPGRYGMHAVGQRMREHILEAAEIMSPGNRERLVASGGFGDPAALRCLRICKDHEGTAYICRRPRYHAGEHG